MNMREEYWQDIYEKEQEDDNPTPNPNRLKLTFSKYGEYNGEEVYSDDN